MPDSIYAKPVACSKCLKVPFAGKGRMCENQKKMKLLLSFKPHIDLLNFYYFVC